MGFWKMMGHVMLIKGAIITGYLLNDGHKNINGFELHNQGHNTILYSESLGQGYEINIVDNQAYIGDSQHNYRGVRALTDYESVFGDTAFVGEFEPELSLLEKITEKSTSMLRGGSDE